MPGSEREEKHNIKRQVFLGKHCIDSMAMCVQQKAYYERFLIKIICYKSYAAAAAWSVVVLQKSEWVPKTQSNLFSFAFPMLRHYYIEEGHLKRQIACNLPFCVFVTK